MAERTKKPVKKRAGKVIQSAISDHAADKAREIREKYGPIIDHAALLRILDDRKSIRYPVKIQFVSDGIEPGLFGRTELAGEDPSDGYIISLHARLRNKPEVLPALILYQSVVVNYGDLATAIDAEIFGAGVLGMDREDYYSLVVELIDDLWS